MIKWARRHEVSILDPAEPVPYAGFDFEGLEQTKRVEIPFATHIAHIWETLGGANPPEIYGGNGPQGRPRHMNELNWRNMRIMFLLATTCGLRLGECIGLWESDIHWGDADGRGAWLEIQHAATWDVPLGTPKTGPRKVPVPMGRAVWREMTAYRDWPRRPRSREHPMFLLNRNRSVIWNCTISSNEWPLLMRHCGLGTPGKPIIKINRGKEYRYHRWDCAFDFHSLRHVYASQLLLNGVSMTTVSRRMGHASIQTTVDTYGHLLGENTDQETHLLDGLLGDAMPTLPAPALPMIEATPVNGNGAALPAPRAAPLPAVQSDEQSRARAMLAAGNSIDAITTALGASRRCVMDWLHDDLVALVYAMRADGWQAVPMARRIGITPTTAYGLMREAGVPIASVPWRKDDGTPRHANGRRSQASRRE